MPSKDYTKTEDQASQEQASQPSPAPQASDTRRLLNTLDRVFSTFREQLQGETPKPFNDNAKIAVDTFKDIVAGLRFETRPRAIQELRGNPLSSTEIQLTWTDVVGNADGYRVERCQEGGCNDLAEVGRVGSTERSFIDSNLSPNTTYRYRVVAFNFRGEKPSNIVDVLTKST